ncbi:MAG: malate dehydrogenase [Gammaproteobacteria bacterium]|nr:malate dehydrogenase [Gammaproteobacteria bacterium]
MNKKNLAQEALTYHELPTPGKIAIQVTKPTATQHDLSLAYTPGVAEPVRKIEANPDAAYRYTSKGNLVAVITDGTAVLGLGNVGALAGKPVMEGKAVLFKAFADINVFDIEVSAASTDEFITTVANIADGFGGINLEDIAAPRCFEIEQALTEKLDIPVFHDDQHGTAIIIAAGLLNALEIQGKTLEDARITCVGAGAAGIASMDLLVAMGADQDNITLVDSKGVIHCERKNLNKYKQAFARVTEKRTLADAMDNADVFIGVSGPDVLTAKMLCTMADRPIVFALSNPDPEILPELAFKTRRDIIMATGRSDFPNQVNNVLGFPYIFRGALDARATHITLDMHIAAVNALKDLTKQPVPQEVLDAYNLKSLEFGKDYIIPKPFDPRLIETVPRAVKDAAIASNAVHKNL